MRDKSVSLLIYINVNNDKILQNTVKFLNFYGIFACNFKKNEKYWNFTIYQVCECVIMFYMDIMRRKDVI